MTDPGRDARPVVVLTAHPLQRIGAFALAALAEPTGMNRPDELSVGRFEAAVNRMADDCATAARVRDTKRADGFWLKCSLSFFPNSPMNHPGNGRKNDQAIDEAVRAWRTRPKGTDRPGVPCVLCGRPAAGYFGKVDVPLAESSIYRNTTPRGHEGTALCWPCVSCFHALPYGCYQTGGPAIAIHSWDDRFLARVVRKRVDHSTRNTHLGAGQWPAREVLALRALRRYADRLTAGVQLLVVSNNNRGQTLDAYEMDQPLAEWLRTTARPPRRSGFRPLLRAHRTAGQLGVVGLARNAFRDPGRIVTACARYLASGAQTGTVPDDTADLAALCFSYVDEVMRMDQADSAEIRSTAARVALLLSTDDDGKPETSGGPLRKFASAFKQTQRLRSWLLSQGVQWVLIKRPKDGVPGSDVPLVTQRGFELLFDPDSDTRAWLNRQLLLVSVLEQLCQRGWRPDDGAEIAAQVDEGDLDAQEERTLDHDEEEDERA